MSCMRAPGVLLTILAIPLFLAIPFHARAGVSVEDALRDALDTKEIPKDLTITYDDMHERFGGLTIVILGDGSVTRTFRAPGDGSKPSTKTLVLPPKKHLELIKILVDLKVWIRLQNITEVGEGQRAKLAVKSGDLSSGIWEPFEEMGKRDRLIHVRDMIMVITGDSKPVKAPTKKKPKKLNEAGR